MNNHQFIVSKYIGFCSGVDHAITCAKQIRHSSNGRVYCLGDIVHNDYVINQLHQLGIITVNNIDDIMPGSHVIIRAHGVSPEVLDKLSNIDVTVVDATCPFVKAIQTRAQQYYNDGYQVVLIVNSSHPEIIGVNGWCNNTAIIYDGTGQIDISSYEKVLIMVQTTFDTAKYENCLENLLSQGVKTLEIINTICYTTIDRQNYAHFVAKQSDLVVVIGNTNSSNTRKLYDIANMHCNNVVWISDNSVPNIDLSKFQKIGFISGASTPSELIEGVIGLMTKNANETAMVAGKELFEQTIQAMPETIRFKPGQKVTVKVVSVDEDGLVVRVPNWKQDAYIPNDELTLEGDFAEYKKEVVVGCEIDCLVKSIEKSKFTLSRKAIEERYKDDALVEGVRAGNAFDIKIIRTGKDCLIGKLGSYTIIVHASQVKLGFVKNLEPYVGKTLTVVSSEDKVDDNKRTISASAKALLLAEKKEKEDNFWNNIELNEIVEGKVVRFAQFGAFVSVRDFDCLAHTSDLAWNRINHPSEVLELNETYEFAVLDLNREKNRVSLGFKQLQPKPWDLAAEKFVPGTVVTGKVARIMEFGAFVELDKNIDGLIHISNVSWEWLEDINKALKVGDEIEVEVLEFDAENRRITLSRKAVLPKPEVTEEADAE